MSISKRNLIYSIHRALAILDLRVVRVGRLFRIQRFVENNASRDLRFFLALPPRVRHKLLKNLPKSKSQLLQDLLVLYLTDFKRNGYFVEFGATNGIDLSNTYLLESEFDWMGILAEPAICWQSELKLNRKAAIEVKCVWSTSGDQIEFNETSIAELSTVASFSYLDLHKTERESGSRYAVETISINNLLSKHKAPHYIDYLSIDTEGSEFEILASLDFEKYSFGVITCEHNFTPQREKIQFLLESQGYSRVFVEISEFDDWYIKSD